MSGTLIAMSASVALVMQAFPGRLSGRRSVPAVRVTERREVVGPTVTTQALPVRLGGRTSVPCVQGLKVRASLHILRWRVPILPVIVVCLVAVAAPILIVPVSLLTVGITRLRSRRNALRAKRARDRAMPDFIDLMRLALQSGCSPHIAFVLLEPYVHTALREKVTQLVTQLHSGTRLTDAIEQFRDEMGPSARPLCAALLASERYGLSLSATLETLAMDARLARQREVELAARRLPVLLLFPLVLCILPAFALLSIVPLLGGGLSALHW